MSSIPARQNSGSKYYYDFQRFVKSNDLLRYEIRNMTATIEQSTSSTEIDGEGGALLTKFSMVQSKPDEGDTEMFDGFEDEIEEDLDGSEDEADEEDDEDEMSVTLEQADLADSAEENIERASQALPQLDPKATWIPPPDSYDLFPFLLLLTL